MEFLRYDVSWTDVFWQWNRATVQLNFYNTLMQNKLKPRQTCRDAMQSSPFQTPFQSQFIQPNYGTGVGGMQRHFTYIDTVESSSRQVSLQRQCHQDNFARYSGGFQEDNNVTCYDVTELVTSFNTSASIRWIQSSAGCRWHSLSCHPCRRE